MEQTKLYIAVDPGFDSVKVIANGRYFRFPFSVIRTDEAEQNDLRVQDSRILYTSRRGITYRVGDSARAKAYEEKGMLDTEMESFYTSNRFEGDSFRIGLDTAVGMAIEENGLYEQMEDLKICMIIALPHAMHTHFLDTVVEKIAGEQEFFLQLGKGQKKAYRIRIEADNLMTVSQTVAAILGETSNESGEIDEEKEYYLTEGPTLVLDGGYYTFGVVPVRDGGNIDERWTRSDTEHAMKNVNMKVAQELAAFRPDIRHYSIEYLLHRDNGMFRVMKNGAVETVDLKKLRAEKIHEVCSDFIRCLNRDYGDLLDYRYVLMTGGTGACFYPQMLEYYKGIHLMDEDHFLLTSNVLQNRRLPIDFAIAAGAYKGMIGSLRGD